MTGSAILGTFPLGFPWATFDPFLFCVHHLDHYPEGNLAMGPAASLGGRRIGQDFEIKDGWRMYHGDVVPGFPRHPHRGFETVTLARRGFVDHSDSLGATARFGQGDAQWMTAGRGIVHSEMFPLVRTDAPNPTELFQIWLNLPLADKMVEPHFSMLWNETIGRHVVGAAGEAQAELRVVAGRIGDVVAPAPPPSSWAAREESDIAIWTIRMDAGAGCTLPAAREGTHRTLYFFAGDSVTIDGVELGEHAGVRIRTRALTLQAGEAETELLLLQGRPIGEPVVQHGPFVMDSRAAIQQAFIDYQRTEFGGWPWPSDGPVHARDKGRFAIHADGRIETARSD